MSQVMIFTAGVGLLLLAVCAALWLAEPSAKARAFRVRQGRCGVSVSASDGGSPTNEETVLALQEALSEAERRVAAELESHAKRVL